MSAQLTTLAQIYRGAAERLRSRYVSGTNSWGCCDAITVQNADRALKTAAQTMFEEYFEPANAHPYQYWWERCKTFGSPAPTGEDQEARRLALLFMEQIALNEGV